jgi:hypothetical protein
LIQKQVIAGTNFCISIEHPCDISIPIYRKSIPIAFGNKLLNSDESLVATLRFGFNALRSERQLKQWRFARQQIRYDQQKRIGAPFNNITSLNFYCVDNMLFFNN